MKLTKDHIGKKMRGEAWGKDDWFIPDYVGEIYSIGKSYNGSEMIFLTELKMWNWEYYVETPRERCLNPEHYALSNAIDKASKLLREINETN